MIIGGREKFSITTGPAALLEADRPRNTEPILGYTFPSPGGLPGGLQLL